MKAFLLSSLLLASVVTSGHAQQAPPATPPALVLTHADSVEMIHRAFRHSRRIARLGTVVFGVPTSIVLGATAAGQLANAPNKVLVLLPTLTNTGYLLSSITQWKRFSRRQEEQAVQRFELHQPQPLYVQRRLMTYAIKKHKL